MKTATSTITTITQSSFTHDDSVIQNKSLNHHNSDTNLSDNNLAILDDTDLELEKIMFEEFAHGLPSDIPMADL
ncbi:hypothetical protein IQ244_09915 [Nostoc sp. LEGE 06077]|uniref:hypothetical protein n=1 Tax=Nostoc sp. LEGE 06077 TaxID=915325 RepID=UPI00187F127E|nr:hypothetical protein [Nostoc sp. LEGE 06077]MBE9206826.1 hypothetical protein [Nostoc sp. LEGE 06077]